MLLMAHQRVGSQQFSRVEYLTQFVGLPVGRLVNKDLDYPFLALLISGGHNLLVLAQNLGEYVQLGTTIDDAIGEAYDKAARWLGLDIRKGGGPALEELALEGDPNSIDFTVPMRQHKDCNFSYAALASWIFVLIVHDAHVAVTTSLSAPAPRAPPTSQQVPPPGTPPRFQIFRRPSKVLALSRPAGPKHQQNRRWPSHPASSICSQEARSGRREGSELGPGACAKMTIHAKRGSHQSVDEDRRVNRTLPPKRASRGASTLTHTSVVMRRRPVAGHHLLSRPSAAGPAAACAAYATDPVEAAAATPATHLPCTTRVRPFTLGMPLRNAATEHSRAMSCPGSAPRCRQGALARAKLP
ncbi:hypothetical protein ZWY2020_020096 [Hordeum vulgare]|nr:hypothetical protein ZWY2020_020096 [Hordeum vulgare]